MYQHIMVPIDGSDLAECVLPHVEAIASGCNVVKVTLVRVVAPFHLHDYAEEKLPTKERQRLGAKGKENAQNYLDKIVEQLKNKGIAAQAEVLVGDPVKELVNYENKNDVDLVVISTHGRSGISEWVWGSVTDRIMRSSCVPVMMVRAPGCVPGI